VRLAPLYDIASALPYGTHDKELRFAMKIDGDYRVFPYRNPWPDAARDLGLDAAALVARVRELASSHRMCSPTLPRLQKSESWIDRCPADWLTWSLLAQPVA